ncbi:anti-sigma factor [Rubrobacter taiwanensis]|jgi:anti-sigma-K factor RskA|uniref:Regulator of SigK n=1 Tax=Rubrobacter taiwanensis TaxID=185139 RepID=A0A4R1BP78_9ACTN|nr:anti-sigma factor [Rubrobacter taiwanensis]TCJ19394.1 anti-sigma factor [Rubrobacter taiwanensis]
MDRARFDDLKEAYVLKALPEEEKREFETYLAAHPELQSEIDELATVADLLALGCEEHEPPPELRRNLLSLVEPEARRSARGALWPSLPARIRAALSWQRLAAGMAAVVLAGLLIWNVALMSQLQEQRTYELVSAETSAPVGEIVHMEETGETVLMARNIPELPEDRTYEIWVIRDGEPVPSGLFEVHNGRAAAPVTTPIEGAELVAVTEEPAGGSPAPTSDPVYVAEL